MNPFPSKCLKKETKNRTVWNRELWQSAGQQEKKKKTVCHNEKRIEPKMEHIGEQADDQFAQTWIVSDRFQSKLSSTKLIAKGKPRGSAETEWTTKMPMKGKGEVMGRGHSLWMLSVIFLMKIADESIAEFLFPIWWRIDNPWVQVFPGESGRSGLHPPGDGVNTYLCTDIVSEDMELLPSVTWSGPWFSPTLTEFCHQTSP